jgi:hypothetical protein
MHIFLTEEKFQHLEVYRGIFMFKAKCRKREQEGKHSLELDLDAEWQ